MLPVALGIFALALVLAIVAFVLRRRTDTLKSEILEASAGGGSANDIDVAHPRPKVAQFHVRGEEAQITFDVPLPEDGVDEVLAEMLTAEALEVVRDKQDTLPIHQVTHVVALAGRGSEPREVGRMALPQRGELPPPILAAPSLHMAHVGYDPVEKQFESEAGTTPPEVVARVEEKGLSPIGTELRFPKAIDVGLRGQGIDPATMQSGEMVRGLMSLVGYSISPEGRPNTFTAVKGGTRTFVREVPHGSGDYAELDEGAIRAFMVDFLESKADRGLLVSDKYSPFEVYGRERKEPRVRFVTRERLQKFVDSLALG